MADIDNQFDDLMWANSRYGNYVPTMTDRLSLRRAGPGRVEVFFRALPRLGFDPEATNDGETEVRILQVDTSVGILTMFPTNNLVIPFKEIETKYRKIGRISFIQGKVVYVEGNDSAESEDSDKSRFLGSYFGQTEPMLNPDGGATPNLENTVPTSVDDIMTLLDGLPSYCTKEPQYGLGFRRSYRAVVRAVESLTEATEIQIGEDCSTAYQEHSSIFVLSEEDMNDLVGTIERVNRTARTAANAVIDTTTYNTIAEILRLPKRAMRYGRTELRRALTAVVNEEKPLTHVEQVELVETFTRNAESILDRKPEVIDDLESGIALARARGVRQKLGSMISRNLPEKEWQQFLRGNPFILSMVFGSPIVKVGDQAFVGGKKISGGGDTIADFLVRNSLTRNAALVEIKTPRSKLLNRSPYRKSVFAPSEELVGSINQALDQKNKFEQGISNIRYHNRQLDIEAHHVQACVLIGTLPSEYNRVRSFELFRHNLKDVVVVTYDELLQKVGDLCEFLEGEKNGEAEHIDEQRMYPRNDVPF